jgi:RNA polymerase I-specific transcription initiation factor RRN5
MESKSAEDGDDASPEAVESRPSSTRKRKRSQSQETSSTHEARQAPAKQLNVPKRLRGLYNDEYRQLLNATISDATQDPHLDHELVTSDEDENEDDRLEASQIGLSVWSPEQKDALFHAIARYGRDDLPRLASVTQKSEPEVHEYLQLLRSGMLELASKRERNVRTLAGHLHAAAELSNDCCDALELTGDALAWLQNTWDVKQEQKEHGEFWLLDRSVANRIDSLFVTDSAYALDSTSGSDAEDEPTGSHSSFRTETAKDTSGDPALLEAVPAVKLLNLSRFLDLSEHVFMNSLDPEGNWRTYEGNISIKPSNMGPRPPAPVSIFNTAFSDIHNVLVSLTRRMVHVALFQATTRLRATDSLQRNAAHHALVKRRDVLAALQIVGLKPNSFDYWASLPRRHKLNWFYQHHHGVSRKREISREEAEKFLRMPLKRGWPGINDDLLGTVVDATAGVADEQDEVESGQDLADSEDEYRNHNVRAEERDAPRSGGNSNSGGDVDLEDVESEDLDSGDETSAAEENQRVDIEVSQLERANDAYLELLDTNNSREHEARLWELLQQVEPATVDLQPVHLPDQPKRAPLLGYGTPYCEWRDWTPMQAEWERPAVASDEDDDALAVENEGSEMDYLEPVGEHQVLDEFSSECSHTTDDTLSD